MSLSTIAFLLYHFSYSKLVDWARLFAIVIPLALGISIIRLSLNRRLNLYAVLQQQEERQRHGVQNASWNHTLSMTMLGASALYFSFALISSLFDGLDARNIICS